MFNGFLYDFRKKLIILFLSFASISLARADNAQPGAFNVGGFNLKLDDAAKIAVEAAKVLEEISRDTREAFDRKRATLEQEKIMLVKKKEQGGMSELEYQTRLENVNTRMKKLESDIEKAEKTGDAWNSNIQDALKGGWQMILAKQQEEAMRKTQVATAVATQAVKNEGDMERLRLLFEKENMARAGILLAAVSASIFASYYGFQFGFRYIESIINIPTLIQETSMKSLKEQTKLKLGITKLTAEQKFTLDDVILAPDIKQKITNLADETQKTHEWGIPYRHLIMYGEPGTGKTMIARIIARKSGMHYAIIKGSGLLQYSEQIAIAKLHALFDWAEKLNGGLVIVFDEADSFLRNRKNSDAFGIALVDAFLSRTNSSSEKYMMVLATNHPESLDTAVLSRVDKKLEIPLPGVEQRGAMLNSYLDKYIKQGTFKANINGRKKEQSMSIADDITQDLINEIAQKIEGFSGRDIEKMISEVKISTISSGKTVACADIFKTVVNDCVEQRKKCETWCDA
jgi:ATPase family AAA domain-containing protein 3A/B